MDLPRQTRLLEWPTLGLYACVYSVYAALTIYASALPALLVVALLSMTLALHSSLQHETLHMLEPRWPILPAVISGSAF